MLSFGVVTRARSPLVVLLDDDELWLRSLARAFKARGGRVVVFTTPEQLLEAWTDGLSADVMVIDFVLGFGWDGARVARAIRERASTTPPPLVLLSGTLEEVGAADLEAFDLALSKGDSMADVVDQVLAQPRASTRKSHHRLRPATPSDALRRRRRKRTPQ